MSDVRIVLCEACGSEGRIYHRGYAIDWRGDEIGGWSEVCECCDGTGSEIIDVEDVELEDIAEFVAEGFDP